MPEFCYQAIDKQGRHLSGSMPAMDESDLHKKLKVLGLWLSDFQLKSGAAGHAQQTGPFDHVDGVGRRAAVAGGIDPYHLPPAGQGGRQRPPGTTGLGETMDEHEARSAAVDLDVKHGVILARPW